MTRKQKHEHSPGLVVGRIVVHRVVVAAGKIGKVAVRIAHPAGYTLVVVIAGTCFVALAGPARKVETAHLAAAQATEVVGMVVEGMRQVLVGSQGPEDMAETGTEVVRTEVAPK